MRIYIPLLGLSWTGIVCSIYSFRINHKMCCNFPYFLFSELDLLVLIVTFIACLGIGVAYGTLVGIGFDLMILLYPVARPAVRRVDPSDRQQYDCNPKNQVSLYLSSFFFFFLGGRKEWNKELTLV